MTAVMAITSAAMEAERTACSMREVCWEKKQRTRETRAAA